MKILRIIVTTDRYEYMGLPYHSLHDVSVVYKEGDRKKYIFKPLGRNWELLDTECDELKEECRSSYCDGESFGGITGLLATKDTSPKGPIKSDGGSSSYYDLPVAEWLLYTLNERQKEGKCYIKTEEIITALLGNDFDYGNIFKSMIRCKGLQDGTGGKAGNSVEYECNKMIYSVNKIKEKK